MEDYQYYPRLDDPEFYKKIYLKKEFNKNKILPDRRTFDEICNSSVMKLLPQQKFLRNYISTNTPYNSVLIYHSTGVGKTCTAISIAEGFKSLIFNENRRILVIVNNNIIAQFKKEIYNPTKEDLKKNRFERVQCTGLTYELLEEEIYLTREDKLKKIKTIINSNYDFHGYIKFVNYVKEVCNWDGKLSSINEIIISNIKNVFSNRVIIIDEVHNIKRISDSSSNKTLPILKIIAKHTVNTKLVLMSATPMYNSATEIVDLINLMLLNDKLPEIKKGDIFKDKQITKEGEEIIKKVSVGFISYLRGEKPPMFPFRIYPEHTYQPKPKYNLLGDKIEKELHIKYLNLYRVTMSDLQNKFYLKEIKKLFFNKNNNTNNNKLNNNTNNNKLNNNKLNNKDDNNTLKNSNNNKINLLDDEESTLGIQSRKLIQLGNIVFPISNGLTYGNDAYSDKIDKNCTFIKKEYTDSFTKRKSSYYQYQPNIYKLDFLNIKKIGLYSSKIKTILDNVFTSNGIIFIYSEYIGSGVIPISLALERNGCKRYVLESEKQLLDDDRKPESKCYLCGCKASDPIHDKKSSKFSHVFSQMKYMLLAGDSSISKLDPQKLTSIINSNNNKNGQNVKVLVGTSKIKEGLDLKRIRQINITEPWYNLSKIEQIIGRGIRFRSHCGLPEQDRNVEVFLLCINNNKKYSKNETIDENFYRLSENKDKEIKKVERLLKTQAIDCNLNKVQNTIGKIQYTNQITSKNRKIKLEYGAIPYSRQCDYMKDCNYNCVWEPKSNKKYKINEDTYTWNFIKDSIEEIKEYIKNMYKQDIIYKLPEVISYVNNNVNVENQYINLALYDLVKTKDIIYDKFNREGYLIIKGNYFIFQPKEIKDNSIPMYYRNVPLKIKPSKFTIIDKIEKININNSNNKDKIDIDKEINKIKEKFKDFNIIYIIRLALNLIPNKYFIEYIKKEIINYKNKKDNKNIILGIRNNIFLYKNDNFIINPSISEIDANIQKYIGFYKNKNYFYLINDKWHTMDKYNIEELKKKYNNKNKIKNLSDISGFIENNKFKIIDKRKFSQALTLNYKESKRTLITGRTCNTFKTDELKNIIKLLNHNPNKYKSKKDLCIYINLILLNYNDISKDKKKWFI